MPALVRDDGDSFLYVGLAPHLAYIIPSMKRLESYEEQVISIFVENDAKIAYIISTIKAQLLALSKVNMTENGEPITTPLGNTVPEIKYRQDDKYSIDVYYGRNGYVKTCYKFYYAEEEKVLMLTTSFLMCRNYSRDPEVIPYETALMAAFNGAIKFPMSPFLGEFTTDISKIMEFFEDGVELRSSDVPRPMLADFIGKVHPMSDFDLADNIPYDEDDLEEDEPPYKRRRIEPETSLSSLPSSILFLSPSLQVVGQHRPRAGVRSRLHFRAEPRLEGAPPDGLRGVPRGEGWHRCAARVVVRVPRRADRGLRPAQREERHWIPVHSGAVGGLLHC
jgi:hypothetical protein